jgi:hypothetical protein
MNVGKKKRSGMSRPVISLGIVVMLFGVAILLIAPVVQSVTPTSGLPLTVDCSSGTYCLVQGLVTSTTSDTGNGAPRAYSVLFCTYGDLVSTGTIVAPAYETCYQQFGPGNSNNANIYYQETLQTGSLAAGQSQVLSFQIPLTVQENGVLYPLLPAGTYYETMCAYGGVNFNGGNCDVESFQVPFSQPNVIATTTTTVTGPVTYLIQYPGNFQLVSVSPAGTSVSTCTAGGSCASGLSFYQAQWPTGTQLSIVMTWNTAEYSAKECTNTQCQTITSGQAFTVTTWGGGSGGTIVEDTAVPNPPITILPQAALGTWSPSTSQTINPSTSPTSVTFTYTPPSGYTCTTDWILYSAGTNQYFDSAALSSNSVTFTYSELQSYVNAQGSTFILYAGSLSGGSLSGTGCVPTSYTVTTVASANVAEWDCSTAGPNTNVYVCPQSQTFEAGTLYFAAIGANGYGITTVYVNGQQATPISGTTNGQPGSGWYSVTLNQNYQLSATAQAINGYSGTCQLNPSTNAGMSITVVDGTTGKPIQGASVILDPGNGASLLTGTTDSTGGVTLCNFPLNTGIGGAIGASNSAPVTITVSANGYQTASESPTAYQGVTTLYTMKLNPTSGISQEAGTIIGGIVILAGIGTIAYGVVAGGPTRKRVAAR